MTGDESLKCDHLRVSDGLWRLRPSLERWPGAGEVFTMILISITNCRASKTTSLVTIERRDRKQSRAPGRDCLGPETGVRLFPVRAQPLRPQYLQFTIPALTFQLWESRSGPHFMEVRIPIHQTSNESIKYFRVREQNCIWLGFEKLFLSFWMQCENSVKQTKSNYPTGFEVFQLVTSRLGGMFWLLLVVRYCRYLLWYFVVTQFFVSEITKRYWISSSSIVNGLLEGSDRSQPLPVILIPCLSIHPTPLFTSGEIRASLESFPWLPSSLHRSNNDSWPPVHPCQGQLCRDLSGDKNWRETWVQPSSTGGLRVVWVRIVWAHEIWLKQWHRDWARSQSGITSGLREQTQRGRCQQLNKSEARTQKKLTPATKYGQKKVIKSKHRDGSRERENWGTGAEATLSWHWQWRQQRQWRWRGQSQSIPEDPDMTRYVTSIVSVTPSPKHNPSNDIISQTISNHNWVSVQWSDDGFLTSPRVINSHRMGSAKVCLNNIFVFWQMHKKVTNGWKLGRPSERRALVIVYSELCFDHLLSIAMTRHQGAWPNVNIREGCIIPNWFGRPRIGNDMMMWCIDTRGSDDCLLVTISIRLKVK